MARDNHSWVLGSKLIQPIHCYAAIGAEGFKAMKRGELGEGAPAIIPLRFKQLISFDL